ncbi:MAG: thioredoxin domain-containing protein [Deltaproteobacteria bacterium]|nr:thioredoxin domain-containing protein [Deltaproteobacteria bacterium]
MARRNVTIWLVIYAVLALLAACGGQGAATSEPASGESPAPPKAGTAATDGKVNIELYVMSECPFGKGAEGVVQKVAVVLPGVLNVEIGFILNETETPGVFESLHGEEEVALDRVQACVGLLYPERQLEFITHDNQTPEPWADAAKAMSFDEEEIRKCVRDGRADEVLTRDARRTEAQTINASPTMFVNGEPYEKSINSLDFFETVCAALGDKAPAVCASPPAALSPAPTASARDVAAGEARRRPSIPTSSIKPRSRISCSTRATLFRTI